MSKLLQLSSFILTILIDNMAKQESAKSVVSAEVTLIENHQEEQKELEKKIPEKDVLEFISRHHLKPLWDEFIEEKRHPKIPLSAKEVLEMINLSPEEQDKIIKTHS
jgi:hypothetical protein